MLEHVPAWIGHAMRGLRAGADKICIFQLGLGDPVALLPLSSPAFADGGAIPARYTADGEGTSPALIWDEPPEGAASLVLVVEDPDAPSPQPLVHAIVWNIDPDERGLGEGAIAAGAAGASGRNSYMMTGWLPPDPPTGHGPHHYAFQIFALDMVPELDRRPGRSALVDAMKGHVLAAGLLTGTYERGQPAPVQASTGAAIVR
jgi:Raf kinase inhibitor-like YbhB/YbcL family protein